MEKNTTPAPRVTLTIGSPEQYPSKSVDENGKRKNRVAFQVTGSKSALEQYNADMVARTGKPSVDASTGNPLFTTSLAGFAKAGVSGTIVRASKPDADGNYNWFLDTEEQRLIDEAVSGADEFTKQAHAMSKYEELKAGIKALQANKRAKQVVTAEVKADLSK